MKGAALGILLMAHGGGDLWNKTAGNIAKTLDRQAPTELALGMANPASLQSAVNALQRRGIRRIVAVPLFVHSESEVLAHTRYVLGLSDKPSDVLRDALAAMSRHHGGAHPHHSFSLDRVKADVPISMTKALDDHQLVADILARRASSLSRAPRRETVILVGHGPVDHEANEAWLATMGAQAERVRRAGGFRAAVAMTIRDDSPPEVRGPAIEALRERARLAARDGGAAIVVPYLISRGGIESRIVEALEGVPHAWDGKTLCPDEAIVRILSDRAKELR